LYLVEGCGDATWTENGQGSDFFCRWRSYVVLVFTPLFILAVSKAEPVVGDLLVAA